ncbi:LysR family transcriptional regulator [Paenibacillus humicola]|uniref:LysR family transcriptional regulator n=1 Tax=Paenibacillus humicola TaxID=3110540 RepID=UPI00237B0592|nr:LysR family transcriptional regulator [Paenibacillus humicola]
MESSDLRIFQAVAREGSITRAAARLGYVQSNVTARIQQLESELQTVLFYRHNRGMKPTPGGVTLLGYADKIVGLLDEAAKAMCADLEPRGPLLIGSTQTTAAVRLPVILARYHKQHPDVRLSLTTGHSDQMTEKVLQFEVEGAFVATRVQHPELQSLKVFEEEAVLVSASGVASLEEAASKPILVFTEGCSYRNVLESWLQFCGLPAGVVMEFGTLETIIGGVSAGLGISLLPRSVVRKAEAEGHVRIHAIPETFSRMNVTFVTRKDAFMSSALRAFLQELAEASEAVSSGA